jgi:glucokinase
MRSPIMNTYLNDDRVVLTLDAGGTNLVFTAIRGGEEITDPLTLRTAPHDLNEILSLIEKGFSRTLEMVGGKAEAISFSFPGPSDYGKGIIGNLPNLPAFRGGVALGPFLSRSFGLPVYINNDGNLFALGEWIGGLLPEVNRRLADSGSTKRFRNILGLTLGSGFGAGIVVDGHVLTGDNSAAGEIWCMRNKKEPDYCAEAHVGVQYVRRLYAEYAGIPLQESPEPKEICDIGLGAREGNREAAERSFAVMGEVAGDAAANALTLVDSLVVLGGGMSGAYPLFIPSFMNELNGILKHYNGEVVSRMEMSAFDLEAAQSAAAFYRSEDREIGIPKSSETVRYDALPRTGVGLSRLGTSRAVALGAYVFALTAIDSRRPR